MMGRTMSLVKRTKSSSSMARKRNPRNMSPVERGICDQPFASASSYFVYGSLPFESDLNTHEVVM
jgi:hypothetical protein